MNIFLVISCDQPIVHYKVTLCEIYLIKVHWIKVHWVYNTVAA